jgi:hypothetical protein
MHAECSLYTYVFQSRSISASYITETNSTELYLTHPNLTPH